MKISKTKQRLIAIGMMLVISTGPIAASYLYQPIVALIPVDPDLSAESPSVDSTSSNLVHTPEPKAAPEEEWHPTPEYLNLTHYFPEGADSTKIEESLAGEAFQVLMNRDSDWWNDIYDYADLSPAQMAKRLGRSANAVRGKYNPKDNRHKQADSSTWTVNSFKKIRMTVTNGEGKAVNSYSNVIEIMAMANLYTYFTGIEDYDLFLSYAENLWENSHSHTVSISSLYYCEGCLSEADELRELAELKAEAMAEEMALAQGSEPVDMQTESVEASTTSDDTDTLADLSESEVSSEEIESSEGSAVIQAGASKQEKAATAAESMAETEPESTSGVIVSGRNQSIESTEMTETESGDQTDGNLTETGETEASTEVSSPSNADAKDIKEQVSQKKKSAANAGNSDSGSNLAYKCPGHVDLIINVKILGLDEKNGLLSKDNIGNDSANITEEGWPGWNDDTIASVKLHSSQDWYEKYGLTVSAFSMKNPLSDAEIQAYISQLPQHLSKERLDVINFALGSVGKVPYYWGGKPASPGYSGNSFGIMTSPDQKGRILKGLDCSGWISWVYWSATGKRLPYEGTTGLALCGSRVNRNELQPGDIIIRTGADAHVIMFLGWTDDGKILCIHESSGKNNNVTVSVRDANWPYYRKLLND